MRIHVIARRRIWFAFSGLLVACSLAALILWGLRLGIDFTGGSLIELRFTGERPAVTDVQGRLEKLSFGSLSVQPVGSDEILVRIQQSTPEAHAAVLKEIGDAYVVGADKKPLAIEISYETVGPTIGNELRQRSFTAVGLVLLAIIAYISFAFRKVSRPVSSWKYGLAAVVALFHDVIIPTGVVAVLGHFMRFEVDVLFVTAVLTVLGFSVHDTIVVFDRIRENLRRHSGQQFAEVVDDSVQETMVRSINTSLTVFLVLMAVYLFGGESTKHFVLILLVGITVGTYSSIFIASPILVSWYQRSLKR